jgi:hypothetical protein
VRSGTRFGVFLLISFRSLYFATFEDIELKYSSLKFVKSIAKMAELLDLLFLTSAIIY